MGAGMAPREAPTHGLENEPNQPFGEVLDNFGECPEGNHLSCIEKPGASAPEYSSTLIVFSFVWHMTDESGPTSARKIEVGASV